MSKEGLTDFYEDQIKHCLKMSQEWLDQVEKLKKEIARLENE